MVCGQTPTVAYPGAHAKIHHIPRGTTELHEILTLRTVVWKRARARRAEGDMRRKGEEFGQCRVTHPDDAGQNGCDKGAREGEHGKGTKHTEEMVQPECPAERTGSWL